MKVLQQVRAAGIRAEIFPDSSKMKKQMGYANAKNIPFVALVGSSGCGKSTLVRILLGLERPERGLVQYDGQDLNSLDVASVRRQMGVVMQQGRIMAGNILNNIIGSLPLTIDDAWQGVLVRLDFGNVIDILPWPCEFNRYCPIVGFGRVSRVLSIIHRPNSYSLTTYRIVLLVMRLNLKGKFISFSELPPDQRLCDVDAKKSCVGGIGGIR